MFHGGAVGIEKQLSERQRCEMKLKEELQE